MEKISQQNHHDIQLKSIRVISLNSFVDLDFGEVKNENIKVETSIGNFGEVLSDTKGKCFLKTKVKGIKEEEKVFEIEVIYEGICESNKVLKEEEFKFFLEVQSIPMLWSYVRETINSIMLKMNLSPILLPVLNITEMMNDINKSRKNREEKGDE